jgi:hypothetical protein
MNNDVLGMKNMTHSQVQNVYFDRINKFFEFLFRESGWYFNDRPVLTNEAM